MTSLIVTTSIVIEMTKQMRSLIQQPDCIAVIGEVGIGKTIAARYACHAINPVTGHFPPAIAIPVSTNASPDALFQQFREILQEVHAIGDAQTVAQMLARNYVKLLVFDDADRLNKRSLNALFQLYSSFGFALMFVGPPYLETLLNKRRPDTLDKLRTVQLSPLTADEALAEFLPHIALPRWQFDPANEADYRLGEYVWKNSNSSLRQTLQILELADAIAHADRDDRITRPHINEAIGLLRRV